MKVQWTPDLATGSPEIDEQHRELFSRVDSLLSAFERGVVSREEVSRVIQFLSDYVVLHFETEEKFMARHFYAGRSSHVAQHAQFVRTFGRLKERMNREGISPELAEDARQLCVDWLVNHIKFSDRALGMFLKQRRQSQTSRTETARNGTYVPLPAKKEGDAT